MDVPGKVDKISCKKGPLSSVIVNICGQNSVGFIDNVDGVENSASVVDLGEHSIIHKWTVNEMPGIPKVHVVLIALEIIRPTSTLNHGLGPLINQVVDRVDEPCELVERVWIDLGETDLSNGGSEHVPNIPPSSSQKGAEQNNHPKLELLHDTMIIPC